MGRCVSRWGSTSLLVSLAVVGAGCDGRPPETGSEAAAPSLATLSLHALPSRPPEHVIRYGEVPSQHGELRVPEGRGPHAVAVLVHGGCFKAEYATLQDLAAMADALKDEGIATWSVEYRRLGEAGGGWPGTYLDVGRAVDHLRALARDYPLDLGRVAVVGHSAGGHLALWTAVRPHLPTESELYVPDPLPIRGVMDLAGPIDMTDNIEWYETKCGDTVITSLLGGTPSEVSERYRQASANHFQPLGVAQALVWGENEDFVPTPLAEAYVRQGTSLGDPVGLVLIPAVGHFEIANPYAAPWPSVLRTIRALLRGEAPG